MKIFDRHRSDRYRTLIVHHQGKRYEVTHYPQLTGDDMWGGIYNLATGRQADQNKKNGMAILDACRAFVAANKWVQA